MLKVYTQEILPVNDTERFFDENVKFFDFNKEDTLMKVGNIMYVGDDRFITPLGETTSKNLPTYAKLALCLTQCPNEFFDNRGCSTFEMEKILVLPRGNLVLKLAHPFEYIFPVKAETIFGDKLEDSSDINVRIFMKGGPLM